MGKKAGKYMTLNAIIQKAVADAVKDADGNKTLAAERLNINRVTLRKYLREHTNRLKSNQRKKPRNAGGNDQ